MMSVSTQLQPVLRFAPSPNGKLHLGHALSALQNEAEAARLGGQLLLRIEDIDPTRCTSAFEAAIHEDLAWLGVRFAPGIRRQSEHMDEYRAALDRLAQMGLLYACTCSRTVIKLAADKGDDGHRTVRNPDGALIYPGTCRGAQRPQADAVMRIDMAKALALVGLPLRYVRFFPDGQMQQVAARPELWGDVVLARKETPTSYHLSVVVDDALQGVTHVVRGQDLEAQTDVHVLLQALLGLPTPQYQFHRLVLDEGDEKMAKSRGSRSLADLRKEGRSAVEIRASLGFSQV